ncbi:MAG TPA: sigma-70 family RNA polymerase sigma factor [Gemmataceae bacterium]|nr:sigma-70 family RNA polymerase sigma factor [Gemmataceae bacterium]
MATGPMNRVLRQLERALRTGGESRTDAQLLERFVARRDEAAFTALVQRHGPMVLGVCRRTAGHADDADDAFQATFLVLARKAASIRAPAQLGAWLYGVAYRTARKARAAADRLRGRERQVKTMPQPAVEAEDQWQEIAPLLDQELSRLPDKYRIPIILCDLEGGARKEVAQRLGVPEGTLSSRLATGRRMLAGRMARYGLAVSGGALAAALAGRAVAAVPAALTVLTIRAAASATAAAVASAKVAALTEGAMKAMLWTKLKIAAVVLTAGLVLTGTGAAVLGPGQAGAAGPAKADPANPAEAGDPGAKPAAAEKDDVWTLDFRVKDLRPIAVETPGQGQKLIWYLTYIVTNPTDREHTFIPDFELTIDEKEFHHDETPAAPLRDFIEQAEDPAGALGKLNLKTSVTIAADPIPPGKSATGVAVWEDLSPALDRCSVYVYGLSNAWAADEKEQVRRKTLELDFKRDGNQMRRWGERKWLYLPSHGDTLPRAAESDELRLEIAKLRKQLEKAEYASAITEAQKALTDKDREIAELRDKLASAQVQVEALTDRCKALEQRIRELENKKEEKPADTPADAPLIEGTVRETDGDLVKISIGSDAGVTKDMMLHVYRQNPPMYLGRLRVIEVRPGEAVGKCVGTPTKPVHVGDQVVNKFDGK